MNPGSALRDFHPAVARWFTRTLGEPSPPQVQGWPAIAGGRNTLILAPTGSGKTLAAFLWAVNHLVESRLAGDDTVGIRIIYVSPLKALGNDIARNLVQPLGGIAEEAAALGTPLPAIRTAVRTGDTSAAERQAILRHPPEILITTPESLYLMLSSPRARPVLRTVQYVIVDEIHAVCGNKRGVHLSLSLERLAEIAEQEFVRIGLSATQRPLERIAEYLGGFDAAGVRRPVAIIDAGQRKEMDLRVECPIADFALAGAGGVWPNVFERLLREILAHRTTLVFVNNRRLAERVAAKLNELLLVPGTPATINLYAVPHRSLPAEPVTPPAEGGFPMVQAYHGSMSRQAREHMEQELKAGRLRVLVSTSALELGIDIGSVDLVVQIQSPKGIARGLQRVGRSGHLVDAQSKGRIFPTHREDLVESGVVAREMLLHAVEAAVIPHDCLDILAQQIVAMVGVEEWDVDALYALVRRSACYARLSRELFESVLRMLAGRYAGEEFRELRPRLSWDRVNGILRPLPGSLRLAVMGGGAIADRGAYRVVLEDGSTRVGEVDEEFVYETRVGDTFLLGSSVWRVTDIDDSRLTVRPAPGEPARMPFWRGEGLGRSYELGRLVGEFRRVLQERIDDADVLPWIRSTLPVDADGAWNILDTLRRQAESTRGIPHDRSLVVEAFHDELGDPRVVLHSPFGRRVNGLLGLVLARRTREATGTDPQMLYNDDGILLRGPGLDAHAGTLAAQLTPGDLESVVLDDLLRSPVFGAQFRQNAARALLLGRRAPGQRTPLWLQRLHAKDLLALVRRYDDFPIVIETVRDVLHDVLDYDHARALLEEIVAGTVTVRTVRTEVPSPLAAGLLLDFIAAYMYEWDAPKSGTSVALNREMLAQVIDLDTVGRLIRPEAIEAIEGSLQHRAAGTRARSPEELMEVLLRVGDLTREEVIDRCEGEGESFLGILARDGRAVEIDSLPGPPRWIAGEDAALYAGLADGENLHKVVLRYLRTHGPVTGELLAARFGLPVAVITQAVSVLSQEVPLVHRVLDTGTAEDLPRDKWCYRPSLERIHRQTLTLLRRDVRPAPFPAFTRFLLAWHHCSAGARLRGTDGVAEVLAQYEGLSLPVDSWERDIIRTRVSDYTTVLLPQAAPPGDLVWCGTGPGRLMEFPRGAGGLYLGSPDPSTHPAPSQAAHRIMEFLQMHGASFLAEMRTGTGLSLAALQNALAELFWNGMITNDLFSEILLLKRSGRIGQTVPLEPVRPIIRPHSPEARRVLANARRAIRTASGSHGRWALVRTPAIEGVPLEAEERAEEHAVRLLHRHGILAREFVSREDLLPWQVIAPVLQRMEMRGEIRRGYFVEGLSGMQFALPEAAEGLERSLAPGADAQEPLLLTMVDPAVPFGPGIPLPGVVQDDAALRVARIPSSCIAFARGEPVAFCEGWGSKITLLGDGGPEQCRMVVAALAGLLRLPASMRPFASLTIEYINGQRPTGTVYEGDLRALGLRREMNQTLRLD